MKLSGIQRLEWTPVASYQMILGTNGCGKSSLLAELSPLPPVPADFMKGGSKLIELEHEGHEFVLYSQVGTTVRHSFKHDGVELNDGGTGAIQNELVRYHLGYFKELHPVLTGRRGSNFSEMSQSERRKWITLMSSADHTYALAVYDRMRVAARDMEGHIKRVKHRLTEETHALGQMSDGEGLEERVKALQDELTDYLYTRQPQAEPFDQAHTGLCNAFAALERSGTAVENVAKRIDLVGKVRGSRPLESVLGRLKEDETTIRVVLDRYQHEYADLETMLQSFKEVEIVDEKALNARLVALTDEQTAARENVTLFKALLTTSDPAAIAATTDEILGPVIELFSQLPDNSNRKINREDVTKAVEVKRNMLDRIDNAEGALRILNQRLHSIDHAQSETCPQCTYKFVPGQKPNERQEVASKAESYKQLIEKAQLRVNEVSGFLEEAETYMGFYRRWRGYATQYPRLQLLWDYIQTSGYDITNPGDHRDVFHTWVVEVQVAVQLHTVCAEEDRLQKLLATAKQGGVVQLAKRLKDIEERIADSTVALKAVQTQRQCLSAQHQLFVKLDESAQVWNDAMSSLESRYDAAIAALANSHVEQNIVKCQGQLGTLQYTLNAKQAMLGIIEDLNRTVVDTELDHSALALLVRELSPKEGFIAEQISGFIECFTSQLNSILGSVWSYDLEILPCAVSNGSLDYQFPMRCGIDGPEPKDISDGSTSQCDMVDFAFRQTVLLYLGLKDYPLLVDELGASFDEAHRPSVNQFIARLMDSHRYSQVFMISHYIAGYGAFTEAEYLVLDSRNIAVPEPNNTQAIFT